MSINVKSTKVEQSSEMFFFLRFLVQVCELNDVPLVHVSSGCIYSGDKGEDADGNKIGFTEEDVPNFSYDQPPCSFYSGSKALGEEVLESKV